MIEVCRRNAEAYARSYIGRTVPILLETPYPDGTVDGLTDTYLSVRTPTKHRSGEMLTVRIIDTDGETLIGEEAE
jgi:tRNA A37 methylthiotransferase MiaB